MKDRLLKDLEAKNDFLKSRNLWENIVFMWLRVTFFNFKILFMSLNLNEILKFISQRKKTLFLSFFLFFFLFLSFFLSFFPFFCLSFYVSMLINKVSLCYNKFDHNKLPLINSNFSIKIFLFYNNFILFNLCSVI